MKVLVTGASGMLGIEVCRIAALELGKKNVVARTHEQLDITFEDSVGLVLDECNPDVIINCAGIVRSRNATPGHFLRVNASGPHVLEAQANKRNMKLVQVSTDCVFDGLGPKNEDDKPKPLDIYSESKALGEVTLPPHLTVRTSFVGLGQRGLISWLLAQKGEVPGYTEAKWNGLTSTWAARKIIELAQSTETGIRHIFGEDTDKYHLLKMASEVMGLDVLVVPSNTVHSDMRLRTVYAFNDEFPSLPLREQLTELARFMR